MNTKSVIGLAALALTLRLATTPAHAEVAGKLKDLRIEGQHFATAVSTMNGQLSIKDPTERRLLVLRLSADCPTATTRIHASDFVLAYRDRAGDEDRSRCGGVGIYTSETASPMIGGGDYASVTLRKGRQSFAAVFPIENEVQEVELYAAGSSVPLKLTLGPGRAYSLFIVTNLKGVDWLLRDIGTEAQKAGMAVTGVENGLNEDTQENVILYREGAEPAARELSQRLML